jgi:hypothetical protein
MLSLRRLGGVRSRGDRFSTIPSEFFGPIEGRAGTIYQVNPKIAGTSPSRACGAGCQTLSQWITDHRTRPLQDNAGPASGLNSVAVRPACLGEVVRPKRASLRTASAWNTPQRREGAQRREQRIRSQSIGLGSDPGLPRSRSQSAAGLLCAPSHLCGGLSARSLSHRSFGRIQQMLRDAFAEGAATGRFNPPRGEA